ncbi:exonuclease domain-containing protein [Streptomyces boncukensis]|uniref:3'-5' exonuclease n=1 Tax=Streptomyces boncukensis TaxID=2711219 RepID=A0A6G4WRV9_9ACTN|nr:exonuclease domain-containing protein [Streptomyces boncukensis]NGO67838.1 3'-5' exonuclease [Streptomyces boncukensis]
MFWHEQEFCGFDVETTGTDPEYDRIVTAAVVTDGGGRPGTVRQWIADPGIPIQPGATAVHGFTTEAARAAGRPAGLVVGDVLDALAGLVAAGLPLVVMNAPYDLTMLEAEAERHGLRGLFGREVPMVLDPMVLDKHVDRYRPGSRRLDALARHYGVQLDDAHNSVADAVAACRVTRALVTEHGKLAQVPLNELHEQQARWAVEQQESLREHFATTPGKEHRARTVRVGWPLIPAMRPEVWPT